MISKLLFSDDVVAVNVVVRDVVAVVFGVFIAGGVVGFHIYCLMEI